MRPKWGSFWVGIGLAQLALAIAWISEGQLSTAGMHGTSSALSFGVASLYFKAASDAKD